MVEDMEECILRFGYSGKLLNIINDEHVDSLVEADEIIEVVCTY